MENTRKRLVVKPAAFALYDYELLQWVKSSLWGSLWLWMLFLIAFFTDEEEAHKDYDDYFDDTDGDKAEGLTVAKQFGAEPCGHRYKIYG